MDGNSFALLADFNEAFPAQNRQTDSRQGNSRNNDTVVNRSLTGKWYGDVAETAVSQGKEFVKMVQEEKVKERNVQMGKSNGY